ncbi:TonB-dependent receptor domain-containing protein [Sphingosinicella sp.]|uniref:TonB-dependent receptor domain-containing protein n=1 Tax=Sphingosinicella sp. TaxID=1917971 RepID=UPI0035B1FDCF
MQSRVRIFSYTTASVAAILAGSAPSWAQDTVTDDELIIVTGTNIRGTAVIGSAVQSLSSDDIARSGKATIAELMRELPVNFAGGVGNSDNNRGQDTSSQGSNLGGGSGVNLRGLGALSTLVLVNGRRVAVSGQFGDFVDISNIPVAAIERIEILQDGASAVYGSDAVGGVVNIILKRKVDGLHAVARLGTTTEGGGTEYQASAVWGTAWDNGNLVLGYEYNKRENVRASQRGMTGDFSDRGGVNWPAYTGRAGTAANIFSGNAAFNGNVAYTVPQGPGTGLTVGSLTPATGGFGNSFDPWNGVDILPEMARHSLFLSFDQEVSDKVSLYGGARYTRRDGFYNMGTGYSAYYGSVPVTNPNYITGVTNNFGVVIDDQPLIRDTWVKSLALEGGVRIEMFGDWQADATVSYSREKQHRYSTYLRDSSVRERLPNGALAPNSIACSLMGLNASNIGSIATPTAAQTFCAGLGYETWNPYSTEPLSAAVVDQLIGYEDLTFNSDVLQGTVKFDGTLFDLPGGSVKLAFGADYRKEKINGLLNFNYRSIDPYTVEYGTTKQDVISMFAEASIPIVSEANAMPGIAALELSGAVRHEMSSSSNLKEFTTTNPKFGFRYAPFEGFNIRGSWGTSFHAPPMRFQYNGPQPVAGGNAIFYANSFYTAPCNTTLVELNGFTGTPGAATGSCTFTGMVVSGGAGPVLKPETAETWTLGLDFTPPSVPGLRVGLNYFNIAIKDRIVRITGGTLNSILTNYFATGTSPYMGNLVFNPDDALVQSLMDDPRFLGLQGPGATSDASGIAAVIYATQTNLARLKTEGFDLSLNYAFDTGDFGAFELFANGTRFTSYKIEGSPGGGFIDKLGVYESTGNPLKFKSRQGISWNKGPVSMTVAANYTDDYKCLAGCYVPSATGTPVLNSEPIKIDSWLTFDFQLGIDLSGFGGAFRDAGLTFNALNVFNKEPPFIDTGRSVVANAPEPYDTYNATIIGRTVSLTLSKRF